MLVVNSSGIYYNGFNMLPSIAFANGTVLETRSISEPSVYNATLTYNGGNNFTLACPNNNWVNARVYAR